MANCLRNDPNMMTPKSLKDTLFLHLVRSLPFRLNHTLVFAIDVLDECDNTQSRPVSLKFLTDTIAHTPVAQKFHRQ